MTPAEVCPDVAPYTIILDAASKSFAATGLRVGWAVMPPAARQRMADILGHVGRLGAEARAGGDGGAAGRRGRDRRLPRRHARARARAARSPGRRVRGDARATAPGRGDRAAGGHLPVGAGGDSRADQRGDAAAAARRAPASPWSPSRRSACARTAAGSASPSAPCRWPRSTPPSRACGPRSATVIVARGTLAALALAFVLRPALFPIADNKHGDAPMRALIAERMVLEPGSAAQPRTYCQFGPLHTTLMRPFIAVDPVAPRSSRVLSLLAGLARFFPFRRSRGALAGERAAALRASRWPYRRCTSRRRRRPPARRCTCCCGSARSSGCWRRWRTAAGCGRSRSPGCSRRWPRSPATTRGWRCPSWSSPRWLFARAPDTRAACAGSWCSRCARPCCRRPGLRGAARAAATRCSSRTTS